MNLDGVFWLGLVFLGFSVLDEEVGVAEQVNQTENTTDSKEPKENLEVEEEGLEDDVEDDDKYPTLAPGHLALEKPVEKVFLRGTSSV